MILQTSIFFLKGFVNTWWQLLCGPRSVNTSHSAHHTFAACGIQICISKCPSRHWRKLPSLQSQRQQQKFIIMNYNYFWKCDSISVCIWKQMQSIRCNFGSPRLHFLSFCVLVRVLYGDCDNAPCCGSCVLRKIHHHVGLDSRETG